MESKPYWPMSRLDLPGMNRYDWIYKSPPPKVPHRARTAFSNVKLRASKPEPPKPPPKDPTEVMELVCYKPSEYRALPARPPLRGGTVPTEKGSRDLFKDLHAPIQITKRFYGDPILSVPIKTSSRASRSPTLNPTRRSTAKKTREMPIHEVLFEESINPHEDIDPWGFSRDEEVDMSEVMFHGIKLNVSRLHPPKK